MENRRESGWANYVVCVCVSANGPLTDFFHFHGSQVQTDYVEFLPGRRICLDWNKWECGKSTIFCMLMSCDSDEKSIDLPFPVSPLMEKELPEEAGAVSDD